MAFVFSDTFVLHPNDPKWLKAEIPPQLIGHTLEGPGNRLEHSAVLVKSGTMILWGGRFKYVEEGMWALDVFNAKTAVSFVDAPPDRFDAYEAEFENLHLKVAFAFFMVILMYMIIRCVRKGREEKTGQGGDTNNNNGSGGGFLGTRCGLSIASITTVPLDRNTFVRVDHDFD